jgi:glutamine cyclotransferase
MRVLLAGLIVPFAVGSPSVAAKLDGFSKPCGSAVSGKFLYLDSYGTGVLSRIDPTTNRVVKRAKIAVGPCGIVAGAGALWVEDYYQNAILRVNPATMKVTNRIFVGRKPWDVAFAFGSAWATNSGATVSRISAKTRKVVKTIAIRGGGSPTCIRSGAGAIWVGLQGSDNIARIDPLTNRATTIPIGHGSELCVDAHDDGIWVSDDVAGTVTHLDPGGKVLATVKAGTKPSDGTRGPDGLEWIPNVGDGTITRIDPATDKVVDTIPVVAAPFVARTAFGSVWVGDFAGSQLWRITP